MNHDVVKDYYGAVLTSSADLKTNACCDATAMPLGLRKIMGDIHPEVLARYYGCGLVAPSVLTGARILDLGCGSGRDVFLLSRLVGPEGRVIGVDMTEEQLAVARAHIDWHTQKFGYAAPNVDLHLGYIEHLGNLDLAPASFDVIVSNCVVNLATDKRAVLQGAYDLLKPGGEMYFSDVYADRRIPDALRADPVLYGECLSGALYTGDFRHLAREVGFHAPLRVSSRPLEAKDAEVEGKLGDIRFVSEEWRLFKHPDLEPGSEDYGQRATYLGGIDDAGERFTLAETARFERGTPTPVDGNTWTILRESRYAPFFHFQPGDGEHHGAFGAPGQVPGTALAPARSSCC